jgi:hypothetical protein
MPAQTQFLRIGGKKQIVTAARGQRRKEAIERLAVDEGNDLTPEAEH